MKSSVLSLAAVAFVLFAVQFVLVAADEGVVRVGVGIVVRPGGSSSGPTSTPTGSCGNSATSCGTYPNCIDVSKLKYCAGGHIVNTYCSANIPKNQSKTQQCEGTGLLTGHDVEVNVTNGQGLTKRINIYVYTSGTSGLVVYGSLEGAGLLEMPEDIEDFKFDFDNQKFVVFIRNLNVSKLTGNINNIVIDRPPVAINGADVYKAYHVDLPSTFTYSNITITVDLSDMSVRNITNVKFYRCGSFNPTTNQCNVEWTVLSPASINPTTKSATLVISGFSVYALGEPNPGATTTTSSTTSSTTSATTSTTSTTSPTTQTTTQNYQSSGGVSSGSSSGPSTTTTVTTTVVVEPEEEPQSDSNTTTNTSSEPPQTIQLFSGLGGLAEGPIIWLVPLLVVGGIFAWKYGVFGYIVPRESIHFGPRKKFKYSKGKKGETVLVLS